MALNDEEARLSDEIKAKLRGCETPEEIQALAQEEGYELSDKELESVTGGWGSCRVCNSFCWDDGRNIGE